MEEKKHKKGLYLKIALVSALGIFLPQAISVLFIHNVFLSLLLGGLSAILVIFILIITLKPLNKVLEGVEILSLGNLNHQIDIRSGDEFEELADSFNQIAFKLKQLLTNLEQDKDTISAQKNKLDIILSSMKDGIIAVDLSKNVVLVNKAACEMTGYGEAELQGHKIDDVLHFFDGKEEISTKAYCQIDFANSYSSRLFQSLTLVGKGERGVKINLMTSPAQEGVQTNLGCILIMHDLTSESELEQMRLDFVSMASHELKTPLTNIIGYLSVYINESKAQLKKEQSLLLDRCLVSARELLSLVENILSVNKIERDQMGISIQPTDLTELLTKAIEDLQNQAKLKNITLALTPLPASLPKVLADPLRTAEVINNLVSNAINYTQAGGRVSVYTRLTLTEVVTTVEDTGIGIPKEAIAHLFNKFFRVSNPLQKGVKGTGLGLYIAKSIIAKLNGKIWVESEVGKGSKFHFSLPIAKEANLSSLDRDKFIGQAISQGTLSY